MDIPVKATVYCSDGLCGHVTRVILNPTTEQVTHLVVAERGLLGIEHVVPLDEVSESTPTTVHLRASAQDLTTFDSFVEAEFVGGADPYGAYGADEWLAWPYAEPEYAFMPVLEKENIPPGELTVRRGTPVEASDGRIGRVDELLTDPKSGKITHLVLRQGHLWGQKDVTISVNQIDKIDDDAVHLKLNKQDIETLPHQPAH
jgi:sporulation protein YlmC with PRC-barrel domain